MDKQQMPEIPTSPERIPATPEAAPEKKLETETTAPETAPENAPETPPAETGELPSVAPVSVPADEVTRDPVLMKVERELEEGLWDAYKTMPAQARQRFKAEGEQVAKVIREGMATGSLVAKNVIKLIMDWLKLIPGVNKWFLRQEAKSKTDAIMAMQEEQKNQ